MAMDAKQWHILSICLFPVITLCGILLAAFLGGRGDATNKLAFSMGVMFSSGVLLAAALVHALPESQQLFDALLREKSGNGAQNDGEEESDARFLSVEEDEEEGTFPWPSTIFGSSFLLLLCIEAMAERFIDRYIGKEVAGNLHQHAHEALREEGHHEEHSLQVKPTQSEESSSLSETPSQRAPATTSVMAASGSAEIRPTTHNITYSSSSGCEEVGTNASENKMSSDHDRPASSSLRLSTLLNMQNSSARRRTSSIRKKNEADEYFHSTYLVTAKRPSVMGVSMQEVHDDILQDVDEKQTINPWIAILLQIVLSIHVLIEGIVLGSTQTVEVIESAFIAIVFHKGFSAFALGSSLVTSGYWDKERPGGQCMFYLLACMYASVDIVGIGTGMALSSSFHADSYVNAFAQAVLGGSFLFVATAELIPGELEKMRVFQFPVAPILFPLLLGYALMTLIANWV